MDTIRLVRERHCTFPPYQNSGFLLVIRLQRRGLFPFSAQINKIYFHYCCHTNLKKPTNPSSLKFSSFSREHNPQIGFPPQDFFFRPLLAASWCLPQPWTADPRTGFILEFLLWSGSVRLILPVRSRDYPHSTYLFQWEGKEVARVRLGHMRRMQGKGWMKLCWAGRRRAPHFGNIPHCLHWLMQQQLHTLCHVMCGKRKKEASVFASPLGGDDAKLWNGQLCIFHGSGSLHKTRIRRREVGRWRDSKDGGGVWGAELKWGGGGVLFKNPLNG